MTNLLLDPLSRTLRLGRRAVRTANTLVSPVVSPLRGVASSAAAAVGHAPVVVLGAAEQLAGRLPSSVAEQLPARSLDVEALEARVTRLEAAAAATTPARAPRAAAKRASAKRASAPRAAATKRSRA